MSERFATRNDNGTGRSSTTSRIATACLLIKRRAGSDNEAPARVVSATRFTGGVVAPQRNARGARKATVRIPQESSDFKEEHTGSQT